MTQVTEHRHKPVPRGLGRTGPVILSYGFRPFFLAAGVWGLLSMVIWIVAMAGGLSIGGRYGAAAWHAHEMLFGYSSAALAGFLLTAVPNWTGRLPVSGTPLLVLFAIWCAGRVALLCVDIIGIVPAAAIDAAFMPALLAICTREIVAGRKWKDLKILVGMLVITLANLGFHATVILEGDAGLASRLATAAYMMLIMIVGGRILPSFTRNWLNKRGQTRLPAPYGRLDTVSLVVAMVALGAWAVRPESGWTGMLCLLAGFAQAVRLARWRGWATFAEGLVTILHLAYGFVVLGFLAATAASWGMLDQVSSLHVMTVGCIGTMTLAVMTRATRGHTGLDLHASPITVLSYAAMVVAALARPLAAVVPDHYMTIVSVAGLAWIAAFALYLVEYAPPLTRKRRDLPYQRGKD